MNIEMKITQAILCCCLPLILPYTSLWAQDSQNELSDGVRETALLGCDTATLRTDCSSQPNILWITVEDMSPTLGCYDDQFAHTPNLDALAEQSIVYTNAFAVSPVCSPSRSTLITGMYNSTMGTQQMRSANRLPAGIVGFPSRLRNAGYFTTNNVKTDYNCSDAARLIEESWDASSATAHWRNRPPEKPFFAVFNDMTTHQSRTMVWPYAAFQQHIQSQLSVQQISNPADVPLPAYYPDTPPVRRTVARYYDCVTVMDRNVGKILEQLESDGLADNTIVFFYSDHGSGLPRHKRLLFDSGMRVALMVRFPDKLRHLAPAAPGTTTDRPVSFVDFAPTVLNLCGQQIPDYMQGIPFLGPNSSSERAFVYGTRDRVDEAFELSRSVRDKRFLYIRNYMPHLSCNQPSAFSDLGIIRQEITRLADMRPGLTAPQMAYAGPRKPTEEFYDCAADPENITNLLAAPMSPQHQQALHRLRGAYLKLRSEHRDVAAFPESMMFEKVRATGLPVHDLLLRDADTTRQLEAAWAAADLVGTKNRDRLRDLLNSTNDAVRYWALIGMRADFATDPELHRLAASVLQDPAVDVRLEAASWLAEFSPSYRQSALEILASHLDHEHWWTALRACRAIELAGHHAASLLPQMQRLYSEHRQQPGDQSLFLAFSAGAFLQKLKADTIPWDFTPEATATFTTPVPQ